MRHIHRVGVAVMLATLVAGCASTPPVSGPAPGEPRAEQRPTRVPDLNLSGFSAAFREGYVDGCESGRERMRRDESRYKNDLDYVMGWNDGYSLCRRPAGIR